MDTLSGLKSADNVEKFNAFLQFIKKNVIKKGEVKCGSRYSDR